MSDIQTKLDYAEAVANWFLEIGESCCLDGRLEESLKCTYLAANILARQNRTLSSVRLEANLRLVAENLSDLKSPVINAGEETPKKAICLHVLSEAVAAGGTTAMAIRWIKNDSSERVHSIALLSQEIDIPKSLLEAVSDSGGNIYVASKSRSFSDRAVWLRNIANDVANYVMLHVDTSDVICGAAFGVRGGPPVLLVNGCAHVFWTCASIADLVVNVRGSNLEETWTTKYRAIPRCATIPIPLSVPKDRPFGTATGSDSKYHARNIIGIPQDATVIITVGAYFKYLPINDLDFLAVMEDILSERQDVYLLAVGFTANSRWKSTPDRLRSRIRCLGILSHSHLDMVHDAADIYVEGFPFGTTTAMLEAAIKGIPVVLAPAQCPPPYGSDGVALDYIVCRPQTLKEYKAQIGRLIRNPDDRALEGSKIRRSVTKHHTGTCWNEYLDNAIQMLPPEHSTYPLTKSARTPEPIHEFWSVFVDKWGVSYTETIEHVFHNAFLIDLQLRITPALLDVLLKYRSLGIRPNIPLAILPFFYRYLVPFLPTTCASNMWRILWFFYRPCLLPRAKEKLLRLFRETDVRLSWYEEYRAAKRR